MFDRAKFKRLVHYIIAQAGSRPGFGATKLNKVLWFADARQFMLTGQSITGAEYVRMPFGPVPDGVRQVQQELERDGLIKCFAPKAEYEGWRFKALKPADPNFLSEAELQIVSYWIRHIDEDHTAQSISEQSHDYGWEIASLGEKLPLYAAMAERMRHPEGEELEWALSVANKIAS